MDLYVLRTLTFWTLIGLCLICLAYPWTLKSRLSRRALHLPLLVPPLVGLHEWAMPDGLVHRPDLLAIITFGSPVFAVYCFRLCLLTERKSERRHSATRLEDLSWSEKRSLLPFNHESEAEQLAKLQR